MPIMSRGPPFFLGALTIITLTSTTITQNQKTQSILLKILMQPSNLERRELGADFKALLKTGDKLQPTSSCIVLLKQKIDSITLNPPNTQLPAGT
jgi:hypothetical protein